MEPCQQGRVALVWKERVAGLGTFRALLDGPGVARLFATTIPSSDFEVMSHVVREVATAKKAKSQGVKGYLAGIEELTGIGYDAHPSQCSG